MGTDAILRFPLPPESVEAGNETIEVASIEVLVFAERYPRLDLELLATALERHRDLIIEDAIAAAEAAAETDRLEAIRDQYEDPAEGAAAVAAAQEEAAKAAEESGEDEEPRGERDADQRRIDHVAPSVRQAWRNEGISSEVILESARILEETATAVWSRIGLPTTVLDPSMPMSLPDPVELAELADVLLSEVSYEREVQVETFVTRAGAPERISFEDAEGLVVEDMVHLVHSIGIPSPDEIRTRYFFSARARSDRNVEGEVRTVRSLAPSPVPLSPMNVTTTLGFEPRPVPIALVLPVLIPGLDESRPAGVNVSWEPPPGDIWGRLLEPPSLVYNVYRVRLDEELAAEPADAAQEAATEPVQEGLPGTPRDESYAAPREELSATPLNERPLTTTAFIDRSMEWGESYLYEVRAMVVPPLGPGRRESAGARGAPIEAIDTFPPSAPTDLQVVRAGSQVRLQWRGATVVDLLGYHIYRHALPAPLAVDDTWELLTAEPILATRFLDSSTEDDVRYAYALVTVDGVGNTSEPLIAEEPGAFEE